MIGLISGPVFAALTYFLLPDFYLAADGSTAVFSNAGRITLSIMVWMGTWWLTEAIHISATALLPVVLFPMLGATSISSATAPYSHPLVFLVLGGFLIAIALEKWGLDKRIAYNTIRIVGANPLSIIAGIMLVTAFLSAFVSNTATTAMMLPIALSVIELAEQRGEGSEQSAADAGNFSRALLLGIAYGASVGGISTIIGTGPNAFLVGFVNEAVPRVFNTEITFVSWLPIGLSVTILMLPMTFLLLTRFLFPVNNVSIEGGEELIERGLSALGKVKRGEMLTLLIFILAAFMWTFRPLLTAISFDISGTTIRPFLGLTDAGISMLCATLLFVTPVDLKAQKFLLDWNSAVKIPWGILLLFGGGLSLSAAVQSTGVAEYIGSQARHIAHLPHVLHVFFVTLSVTTMTELTSNVATTASLLPILTALSPGLGLNPYILSIACTLASSCAFMMPVATPPNAIVFGSGRLTIPEMVKAGIWLNLIGIIVITAISLLLVPLLFS